MTTRTLIKVDAEIIRSSTLSLLAKGAYVAVAAAPPDVKVTIDWLAGEAAIGKARARRLLVELVDAGLMRHHQDRDGGRFFYWWELVDQQESAEVAA